MMSRTRIGIAVLTVLVLAGGAVAMRPALAYPFLPAGKAREAVHDDEHLKARLAYPEFGRRGIDAAITAFREDVLTTFHEESEEHVEYADGPDTLDVTYDVVWRTWRYASVVFTVNLAAAALDSIHTSPTRPRIITYRSAHTYDILKGRELTFGDVGTEDAANAAVALIREELRGVSGVEAERMAKYLRAGSLTNFVLRGDDVVFYLGPGQVAPPEQGTIEVAIPRAAFR